MIKHHYNTRLIRKKKNKIIKLRPTTYEKFYLLRTDNIIDDILQYTTISNDEALGLNYMIICEIIWEINNQRDKFPYGLPDEKFIPDELSQKETFDNDFHAQITDLIVDICNSNKILHDITDEISNKQSLIIDKLSDKIADDIKKQFI